MHHRIHVENLYASEWVVTRLLLGGHLFDILVNSLLLQNEAERLRSIEKASDHPSQKAKRSMQ
jgi:hypothetical protein